MNNLLNELNYLKSTLNNLPMKNLSDLDLNKTELFIVDINNGLLCSGIWEEHLEGASTLIICGCLCGIRMIIFEMSLLTMYRVG